MSRKIKILIIGIFIITLLSLAFLWIKTNPLVCELIWWDPHHWGGYKSRKTGIIELAVTTDFIYRWCFLFDDKIAIDSSF